MVHQRNVLVPMHYKCTSWSPSAELEGIGAHTNAYVFVILRNYAILQK